MAPAAAAAWPWPSPRLASLPTLCAPIQELPIPTRPAVRDRHRDRVYVASNVDLMRSPPG